MGVRSFIDTNILLYAESSDAGVKQIRAARLVRDQMNSGTGVLSSQVLQEFVAAGLRKLKLPATLIHQRLEFFGGFDIVPTTPALVAHALDLQQRWQLAFYDSMILQAAKQSRCAVLFSEDMASDSTLAGVRLVNPFA